ncbi:MAG: hypothetical protein PXZ07_02905 [Candidatus Eremiobacteraeota bacterium]|nr:hypothetical protein [Candidatus Eremiobacteraeota bacterium]
MKIPAMLFGAVAAAALLAACGGGGAPALPTNPPPVGGPGNPAVSSSARPAMVGDTFAFSGSSLENDVYTYPVGSPFPNTSTAAKISENVIVTASADPLGAGGTDFHSTTTTVGTSATRTATGDSYYSTLSAGSGTDFVLNAQQSVDDSKNTYAWSYTTPQILDELPESAGATWTNSPAGTYNETDADRATISRTTNADGTYTESDSLPTGAIQSMAFSVQPDGSGTWAITFVGYPYPSIVSYTAPTAGTIAVSVLNPTPTPSPGAIGTPAPNPPIVIATPAAWFSPSPKLYQESDTVSTGVTFPASCAVPSAFGASGNSIVQVINKIDPIFGLDEVTTTTTYTAQGFGPVCVAMNDVQTYYYDYLNDTAGSAGLAAYVGTPQLTKTYAQTLTLQTAGTAIQSSGRSTKSLGIAPIAPALFAADRTNFRMHIARERAQARTAFAKMLVRSAPALFFGGNR